MSTLVLARKHRPRSFEQMVGQEHVVQALSNALASQRLHHAYLFTGTRGVGKTTVSRILAKSLNCTGPDGQGGITPTPCGVCNACQDIDSGRFVDYVELDAASNRGVDEITQLLDQAVYKPVVGRFKVYMIDEVHMLSTTAFNAMLKTLEEPPEYLKFVLATTDPQKVPVTVLSRCLQFNLRPMAAETVYEHLQRVLQAEGIEADEGALRLIARGARGSMRDALSLTDQAIAYGAGQVLEPGVRSMLGAVDRSHVAALIDSLAAGDGAAVVQQVNELRAEGVSAAGTLEDMATLLQEMAVLQAVPEALSGTDPDAGVAARLAQLLRPDDTQLLYSIALHGRGELALSPDEYSGLVMVLLRMLAFRAPGTRAGAVSGEARAARAASQVGGAAVAAAPVPRAAAVTPKRVPPAAAPAQVPPWEDIPEPARASAQAVRDAAPVQASAQAAPAQSAAQGTPLSDEQRALGDRWAAVVEQLNASGAITALVRELAMQAQCVAIEDEGRSWRLRVERETLRNPAHRDRLQQALGTALGHPASIEVEAGAAQDTPARREAAAREARQREAESTIQNDPLVLQLMQQFKTARIVPGSIKPI